jgi:hypothetical protein
MGGGGGIGGGVGIGGVYGGGEQCGCVVMVVMIDGGDGSGVGG